MKIPDSSSTSSLALSLVMRAAFEQWSVRTGTDESPEYRAYFEGGRDSALVAALWAVGHLDDRDPLDGGYNALRSAIDELLDCPDHQAKPPHWGDGSELISCPRIDAIVALLARLAAS